MSEQEKTEVKAEEAKGMGRVVVTHEDHICMFGNEIGVQVTLGIPELNQHTSHVSFDLPTKAMALRVLNAVYSDVAEVYGKATVNTQDLWDVLKKAEQLVKQSQTD